MIERVLFKRSGSIYLDDVKAIVFDLDGTLLNTIGDITKSINYALKCYDISPCSEEEVKSFVGNGLKMALSRAISSKTDKHFDENDQNLMYELMENYYHRHPLECTKPYDGIPELLSSLEKINIPFGVLSNKDDDLANSIIRHFFPMNFFLFVRGKRKGIDLKPSRRLTESLLLPLGIGEGEAVFVGDSEVDYETGRNYSSPALIVSYGFRKEKDLRSHGIEDLSANVHELRDKILKLL